MEKPITIVDENNKVIGSAMREEAVKKGLWHRIVVIFIFNSKGQLYIQKRSPTADTCPDMWDHSAAGHVDTNENPEDAAKRELFEELGIRAENLTFITNYKKQVTERGVQYNRFWHLYKCVYEGTVNFDENEVAAGKFVDLDWLQNELQTNHADYTDGLRSSLENYLATHN